MSLSAGRGKLFNAMKTLRPHWEQVQDIWNDPVRQDFEENFWNHLDSIPAYNEDVEIQPESVALLKDEITRADAVLFATPEYNASVPGSLKNALDWISRPFADNPLREKRPP